MLYVKESYWWDQGKERKRLEGRVFLNCIACFMHWNYSIKLTLSIISVTPAIDFLFWGDGRPVIAPNILQIKGEKRA